MRAHCKGSQHIRKAAQKKMEWRKEQSRKIVLEEYIESKGSNSSRASTSQEDGVGMVKLEHRGEAGRSNGRERISDSVEKKGGVEGGAGSRDNKVEEVSLRLLPCNSSSLPGVPGGRLRELEFDHGEERRGGGGTLH